MRDIREYTFAELFDMRVQPPEVAVTTLRTLDISTILRRDPKPAQALSGPARLGLLGLGLAGFRASGRALDITSREAVDGGALFKLLVFLALVKEAGFLPSRDLAQWREVVIDHRENLAQLAAQMDLIRGRRDSWGAEHSLFAGLISEISREEGGLELPFTAAWTRTAAVLRELTKAVLDSRPEAEQGESTTPDVTSLAAVVLEQLKKKPDIVSFMLLAVARRAEAESATAQQGAVTPPPAPPTSQSRKRRRSNADAQP
ncbi:hypothetical protein C8R43DRAFT_1148506 [Mycena crocata]|nr:hypothetical protein C8R43DRAFT_1148506 [Mycena crocata]